MFTYNIQLAGYDYKQYDEKGEITLAQFKDVLYSFPWEEQMKKADELKEGCSATVSVVNTMDETSLWVSVASDAGKPLFLVGYVYYKEVKGMFGLGKAKTKKWVDIYALKNLDSAMEHFKLYFAGRKEEMVANLSREDKFDSMEAFQ